MPKEVQYESKGVSLKKSDCIAKAATNDDFIVPCLPKSTSMQSCLHPGRIARATAAIMKRLPNARFNGVSAAPVYAGRSPSTRDRPSHRAKRSAS